MQLVAEELLKFGKLDISRMIDFFFKYEIEFSFFFIKLNFPFFMKFNSVPLCEIEFC